MRRKGKPPSRRIENDQVLIEWLYSHLHHPYYEREELKQLSEASGLTTLKIDYWFRNARKRIRRYFAGQFQVMMRNPDLLKPNPPAVLCRQWCWVRVMNMITSSFLKNSEFGTLDREDKLRVQALLAAMDSPAAILAIPVNQAEVDHSEQPGKKTHPSPGAEYGAPPAPSPDQTSEIPKLSPPTVSRDMPEFTRMEPTLLFPPGVPAPMGGDDLNDMVYMV